MVHVKVATSRGKACILCTSAPPLIWSACDLKTFAYQEAARVHLLFVLVPSLHYALLKLNIFMEKRDFSMYGQGTRL